MGWGGGSRGVGAEEELARWQQWAAAAGAELQQHSGQCVAAAAQRQCVGQQRPPHPGASGRARCAGACAAPRGWWCLQCSAAKGGRVKCQDSSQGCERCLHLRGRRGHAHPAPSARAAHGGRQPHRTAPRPAAPAAASALRAGSRARLHSRFPPLQEGGWAGGRVGGYPGHMYRGGVHEARVMSAMADPAPGSSSQPIQLSSPPGCLEAKNCQRAS